MMLLVDDLPLISDHSDIEQYINRFREWDDKENKDVSPIFPRDLLSFVTQLVDNLSLYIKKQDNPASPTVADSVEIVCTNPGSFRTKLMSIQGPPPHRF